MTDGLTDAQRESLQQWFREHVRNHPQGIHHWCSECDEALTRLAARAVTVVAGPG